VDEVSAEGFARGVQQIFAAPERLTRMGEAAIAYSRKSFTETNASAIFRSYG
jgi:hypothetical protein